MGGLREIRMNFLFKFGRREILRGKLIDDNYRGEEKR